MVEYKNKQGQQGALLGVNVRPSTEGDGKGDGLIFRLIPEEPVVAFRKFHFKENSNWVYLHKNKRVYANVDMASDEGMAFAPTRWKKTQRLCRISMSKFIGFV